GWASSPARRAWAPTRAPPAASARTPEAPARDPERRRALADPPAHLSRASAPHLPAPGLSPVAPLQPTPARDRSAVPAGRRVLPGPLLAGAFPPGALLERGDHPRDAADPDRAHPRLGEPGGVPPVPAPADHLQAGPARPAHGYPGPAPARSA